jgi:xanthine dehydrogenase accessory factor
MEFSWEILAQHLNREARAAAVCTIIAKRGSVPRGVGTRMLVSAAGAIAGTIGGGIGEHEVIAAARRQLAENCATTMEISLAGEQDTDSHAICGGWFRTLIIPWTPERDGDLARRIADGLDRQQKLILVEAIGGGLHPSGQRWLCENHEHTTVENCQAAEDLTAGSGLPSLPLSVTGLQSIGNDEYFISHLLPPPALIIFGGGHLAVPLAEMAAWCGFAVTVIDDREEFSQPERFPRASRVITAPMEKVTGLFKPSPSTYHVLITREHRHDELLLRQLLGTSYAYLGMIGSRRRTATVKKRLIDNGFPVGEVHAIHAPIGLAIGAQTPEEIAVSIMAEIIQVRQHTENGGA